MLRIVCPWCGPREEEEFRCGGEPFALPAEATPEAWARALYVRKNTAGLLEELWVHSAGCRQWFRLERDTRTHEIVRSSRLGEGEL